MSLGLVLLENSLFVSLSSLCLYLLNFHDILFSANRIQHNGEQKKQTNQKKRKNTVLISISRRLQFGDFYLKNGKDGGLACKVRIQLRRCNVPNRLSSPFMTVGTRGGAQINHGSLTSDHVTAQHVSDFPR